MRLDPLKLKRAKHGLIEHLGNLDAEDAKKNDNAVSYLKEFQTKSKIILKEHISLKQSSIGTFEKILKKSFG